MATNAVHTALVSVSDASGGTYTEISGLDTYSLKRLVDMLDTTDIKDTTGERTRLPGLGDGSLQISGKSDTADTLGWVLLRTAAYSKAKRYIKVLPTGAAGKRIDGYISDWEESGSVDGITSWSCTLQKDGDFTSI